MKISKITIQGMDIEDKEGQIYIDGKHIDTGKYRTMWLTTMFFIGSAFGVFALGLTLLFVEYLPK